MFSLCRWNSFGISTEMFKDTKICSTLIVKRRFLVQTKKCGEVPSASWKHFIWPILTKANIKKKKSCYSRFLLGQCHVFADVKFFSRKVPGTYLFTFICTSLSKYEFSVSNLMKYSSKPKDYPIEKTNQRISRQDLRQSIWRPKDLPTSEPNSSCCIINQIIYPHLWGDKA